jgi:AraC-like DNA-binding protein
MKEKLYEIEKYSISDHKNPICSFIIDKITLTSNTKVHWHNYYEIEYILDGCAKELLNGKLIDVRPGLLHIISTSDFHEHIIDTPLTLIRIGFDISNINPGVFDNSSEILKGKLLYLSGEEKAFFDSLLNTILQNTTLHSSAKSYAKTTEHLIEALITTAAEYASSSFENTKLENKKEINTALAYIHANFKSRLTLDEVAAKIHFSPSYFSRYFHENMKVGFVQYIKSLRIEYATNLIANTGTDIIDICYESGFSSPSSFSNEFKKIHNISPTQYRMREKEIKKMREINSRIFYFGMGDYLLSSSASALTATSFTIAVSAPSPRRGPIL